MNYSLGAENKIENRSDIELKDIGIGETSSSSSVMMTGTSSSGMWDHNLDPFYCPVPERGKTIRRHREKKQQEEELRFAQCKLFFLFSFFAWLKSKQSIGLVSEQYAFAVKVK